MARRNFCKACSMLQHGVRFRKTPPHTCKEYVKECTKVKYASEDLANKYAEQMKLMYGIQISYFCDTCEVWHLTSSD